MFLNQGFEFNWMQVASLSCLLLCFFSAISTPALALVTKATSKVPLSPRAPWDTRHHPSRAPSTPTRPTVTEAPSHSWTSRGVSSSSFKQTSPYTFGPPSVHYIIPTLFQASLAFDLFHDSLQQHWNMEANRYRNQKHLSRHSASLGW